MSFISISYLVLLFFVFLTRLIFNTTANKNGYLLFLLLASLIFYVSYIPRFIFLLLGITLIDFVVGRKIDEAGNLNAKRFYLAISIVSNLGILAFYKYSQFFVDTVKVLSYIFDHPIFQTTQLNIALPLGISFFTFQSMSYTIDVYRGVIRPEKRYWRFLLFVSFFTHLVSGPIVRARELVYQFDRKRKAWPAVVTEGLYLIVRGFFLKCVVADNLAEYVNNYWRDDFIAVCPSLGAWMLAFFFGCQIFADFEGYTSIARGSAYLLGFRLPLNFNFPYLATSFRDFWTRWHITLSTWIRDYFYVSIGGNRVPEWRFYFNLFLVMTIAGLWHGAAWTFVIWGVLHGTALVLERVLGFQKTTDKPFLVKVFWFGVVQGVVLLGWIYFRADSAEQAVDLIQACFNGKWDRDIVMKLVPGLAFTAPIVLMHLRGFLMERQWFRKPEWLEKVFWSALMLYAILSISGKNSAFIYFHF